MISIGPTTTDTERQFDITGETFRVTYDVTILEEDEFPTVIIDIDGEAGEGPFVQVSETEQDSFISTAGPGTFDGTFTLDPPNTARYSIIIEDCGGQGGGNPGGGSGGGGGAGGGGAGNPAVLQYSNDPGKGNVVPGTIPKKPLPNTGGASLLGFAVISLAFCVVGISVLSNGSRR
ncbi:MAG: hypothetical protein M3P70_07690 [Actinomycetota bacterium]|nr:hypothetical protein [Actinomycetota bacterium]